MIFALIPTSIARNRAGVGLGAVAEDCHASLFITAARQEFQYVQQ